MITTIAGNGVAGANGDDGPAAGAELNAPQSIVADANGNLFIADTNNHRIRRIDAQTGLITTVAGNGTQGFSGDGDPAVNAQLDSPAGVAFDADGNLLIADTGNNRLRLVDSGTGVITSVTTGPLNQPQGIAVDINGDLLIANTGNNEVLRVDSDGVVTVVAGNGSAGFDGDGGTAVTAELDGPTSIAVDSDGNIFVSDSLNHRVRRIDADTSIIPTVAGNGTTAELNTPQGIVVDPDGNLFVADSGNNRISKVRIATGAMTTVAGLGIGGFSDNKTATVAQLNGPGGVALVGGQLVIADTLNHRVRKLGVSALRDPTLLNSAANPGVSFSLDPQIDVARGLVVVSHFAGAGFPVYISTNGGKSFSLPDRTVLQLQLPFGPLRTIRPPRNLTNASFRTFPVRQIVVDPVRPGVMYALEAVRITSQFTGGLIDDAEIQFSFSRDNGLTWQQVFTVNGNETNFDEIPAEFHPTVTSALNDDNFNRLLRFAEDLANEVITGQALPALTIDENGNLAAIWYDTRRDPDNHNLDVFGTISTDGGENFSSNFRLTTESFDPDLGIFPDANGVDTGFLGDRIGVASAGGNVFAAWTDTRNGQAGASDQDIFFASFSATTALSAPQDRFEDNDTMESATQFGEVVIETEHQLVIDALDEDWFAMEAGATGSFIVSISAEEGGESLGLEIFDDQGNAILDGGGSPVVATDVFNDAGILVGTSLEIQTTAGDDLFIKVTSETVSAVTYSLSALNLTEDFGETILAGTDGDLNPGDRALFRMIAGVTGFVQVNVSGGEDIATDEIIDVTVFDADGVTVLAQGLFAPGSLFGDGPEVLTVPVEEGQTLYVRLSGESRVLEDVDIPEFSIENLNLTVAQSTTGSFSLELSNMDQFTLPVDATLNHSLVFGQIQGDENAAFLSFTAQATGTLRGVFTDPFGLPFVDERLEILDTDGNLLVEPVADFELFELDVQLGQELIFRIFRDSSPVGSDRLFMLEFFNQFDQSVFGKASLFFPAAEGLPSDVATGDLNGDGLLDVVITSSSIADVLTVYLQNADGTYQSPVTYDLGAGQDAQNNRELIIVDVDNDQDLDVVVTNPLSADISIFLNRDDTGDLEPGRRFDTTFHAASIDSGDFDNDGFADFVVGQNLLGTGSISVQFGNGDGTVRPQVITPIDSEVFPEGVVGVNVADLDNDGNDDIVVFGRSNGLAEIFSGLGNGTFVSLGTLAVGPVIVAAEVVDVNDDGIADIVAGDLNSPPIFIRLNDGAGNFGPQQQFFVGVDNVKRGIFSLAVGDFSSQVEIAEGAVVSGPEDSRSDIIVYLGPRSGATGKAQIVVIPGLSDDQGAFDGFGAPQLVGQSDLARQLDVNGIVAADRRGFRKIFEEIPELAVNDTFETARDLGTVYHDVQIKQVVGLDKSEAWFKFTVPVEVVSDFDQVVDISAGFEFLQQSGLKLEVFDSQEQLLVSGERVRLRVTEGTELFVRISGVSELGEGIPDAGAFSLIVNVLPQIADVTALALVPGGTATGLLVTLQGDEVDASAAEDVANWTVTSLGADDVFGTADDQVIPLVAALYNPTANVEVVTELSYPTTTRQTVTLLFDQSLPVGSFIVEASANIQTRDQSSNEDELLTEVSGFNGHPIVHVDGQIEEGGFFLAEDVVEPPGVGDLSQYESGTPFLQQLYDDLSSLLDELLVQFGDDIDAVTNAIIDAIASRILLGESLSELGGFLLDVFFLDPVSFEIVDPGTQRNVSFNAQTNAVNNTLPQTFVQVGGNVELVVVARPPATNLTLNVADVPPAARGVAMTLGPGGVLAAQSLTRALRSGQVAFNTQPGTVGADGGGLNPQTPTTPAPGGQFSFNAPTTGTTGGTAANSGTTFSAASAGTLTSFPTVPSLTSSSPLTAIAGLQSVVISAATATSNTSSSTSTNGVQSGYSDNEDGDNARRPRDLFDMIRMAVDDPEDEEGMLGRVVGAAVTPFFGAWFPAVDGVGKVVRETARDLLGRMMMQLQTMILGAAVRPVPILLEAKMDVDGEDFINEL